MDARFTGSVLALVTALSAAGWWWWNGQGRIDADDPAQVARGQAVYGRHCAQCHGAQLQGEPDWRVRKPNGELPAPPHDASGHTWHHDDEYLFAVTKHGLARFAPPDYKSAMPSGRCPMPTSAPCWFSSNRPGRNRQRQQALNDRPRR